MLTLEHGNIYSDRLGWYIFVWVRTMDRWHVGYFVGTKMPDADLDGYHDYFRTDGAPTDYAFSEPPTFQQVDAVRERFLPPEQIICYEVFERNWIRVFGQTIGDREAPCN